MFQKIYLAAVVFVSNVWVSVSGGTVFPFLYFNLYMFFYSVYLSTYFLLFKTWAQLSEAGFDLNV